MKSDLKMPDDVELLKELSQVRETLLARLGETIVGQRPVLEELLVALFAEGHALLLGVPGLAKTLIVRTLAELLDLEFQRIQFTPDLMPTDVTGTEIIQENRETGRRELVFLRGPVFTNILLADEINRTPPKTQAALLEAMQERQVTVGGNRFALDPPFFVLATQNPIEQEGTYPLPEAQLDRFMLNIVIDYPAGEAEEVEIVLRTTGEDLAPPRPVLDAGRLLAFQSLVRRVPVARTVAEYAVRIVRATRPGNPKAPKIVRDSLRWGAGPRAARFLVLAAKALAAMHGRPTIAREDIRRVAPAVLRHRLVTNYAAQADGITPEAIIRECLEP